MERHSRLLLLLRNDLKKNLVAADEAELVARALLDRLGAGLQVAHLGIEGAVAPLELRVLRLLGLELVLQAPRGEPASLAEPERILDQHDEGDDRGAEELHRRSA